MPNWQHNHLIITGTQQNLETLTTKYFTNGLIDFNKIIPQPDNIEQGGCSGKHPKSIICWYTWRNHYWGTKWGPWNTELPPAQTLQTTNGPTLYHQFYTAWSQPEPILQALNAPPNVNVHCLTVDEFITPEHGTTWGQPWDYLIEQPTITPIA